MKAYALTLTVTITFIFIVRIFYPDSIINVSHNLNLFSVVEINTREIKNVIHLYLTGSILLSYLIFHNQLLFKLIYCLLIIINIILIIFSLKQF